MLLKRIKTLLLQLGLLLAVAGAFIGLLRASRGLPEIAVLTPDLYAAALATFFFWFRAPYEPGRERTFWRLWAAGSALWVVNDSLLLVLTQASTSSSAARLALAFTFVPQVAMTAALVLQPEIREGELRDPVVRYEAALVALCWLFLYLLLVAPWTLIVHDDRLFWSSFVSLHLIQDGLMTVWLGILGLLSRGSWRRIYFHLASATLLLSLTIRPLHVSLDQGHVSHAMLLDALLAFSFLWMAWTAVSCFPLAQDAHESVRQPALGSGSWLAALTALGIPGLAAWFSSANKLPSDVLHYRLLLSLGTILVAIFLVYRRESIADAQSERFLARCGASLADLRRLQARFAAAEKLASLGQLAAGAAHEINNPVAAMLGYSELIRSDSTASDRALELARKIGEQSRRIRSLVHDLLSLTDQHPLQVRNVDAAALLQSAAALRRIASEARNTSVRLLLPDAPLEVPGDPDKLLQVFYALLLALAATGDPTGQPSEINVRAVVRSGRLILQFAQPDSSCTLPTDPDPALRAARGVGLSFALCQSIIREHGGALTTGNLSGGACTFQIDLPGVEAPLLPAPPRHTSGFVK